MSLDVSILIGVVGLLLTVIVAMIPPLLRARNHRLALQEIEIYERWSEHGAEGDMRDLVATIGVRVRRINHPLTESFSKNWLLTLAAVYLAIALVAAYALPGSNGWLLVVDAAIAVLLHFMLKTDAAKRSVTMVGAFFMKRRLEKDHDLESARVDLLEERLEMSNKIARMVKERHEGLEDGDPEAIGIASEVLAQNEKMAIDISELRHDIDEHYYEAVEMIDRESEKNEHEKAAKRRVKENRRGKRNCGHGSEDGTK